MEEAPNVLERELQTRSGETVLLHVEFPVKSPDHADEFICIHGITTATKSIKRSSYGIDGVQALYLALRSLHALILKLNSERSEDEKIFWIGGMDAEDLGLPLYNQ